VCFNSDTALLVLVLLCDVFDVILESIFGGSIACGSIAYGSITVVSLVDISVVSLLEVFVVVLLTYYFWRYS
jgi:hypothetical protein